MPFSPHLPANALLFFILSALILFASRYLKDPPPRVKGTELMHGGLGIVQMPRILMQIFLSMMLTIVSLKMITSPQYDPASKHWAYGVVGTVLGFWLRAK